MKHLTLLIMTMIISIMAISQTTLRVHNTDKNPVTIDIERQHLSIQGDSSVTINIPLLYSCPEYTIYTNGNFGSSQHGTVLPQGKYVMALMWNKKNEVWRTTIQPEYDYQ